MAARGPTASSLMDAHTMAARGPTTIPTLSLPLGCLDDMMVLEQRREILPHTLPSASCLARSAEWLREQRAMWSGLLTNGGDACDDGRKIARVQMPPYASGWGATLHSLIKPLMHALHINLSVLTPSAPLWVPTSCAGGTLACLFAPLSECDGRMRVTPHTTITAGNRSMEIKLSQQSQQAAGRVFGRGWFWTTASLTAFVLRPSAMMEQQTRRALHSTGLGAALAHGEPVVGLHVRRGWSAT
jgi:hypothetical protein